MRVAPFAALCLTALPALAQDEFAADAIVAEILDTCEALGTNPLGAAILPEGSAGATADGAMTMAAVSLYPEDVDVLAIHFVSEAPPGGEAVARCTANLFFGGDMELGAAFGLSVQGAFTEALEARYGAAEPFGGPLTALPSGDTAVLLGWEGDGWSARSTVSGGVTLLALERDEWAG